MLAFCLMVKLTAQIDVQEYGEETEGHSVLQEYLKNK